jgi:hypothetical protein
VNRRGIVAFILKCIPWFAFHTIQHSMVLMAKLQRARHRGSAPGVRHRNAQAMEETLTIADAAGILGVSERSLRRYLGDPGNAALTRQATRQERRQTRTGPRIATVVLASELERIRDAMPRGRAPEAPPGERRQERGGNAGNERGESPPLPPFTAPLIEELRRQIEAKDQEMRERLAEQSATIEDLRQTKDALLQRLADSEARLALVLAATDRLQIAAQEAPKEVDGGRAEVNSGEAVNIPPQGKPWRWAWWKRTPKD